MRGRLHEIIEVIILFQRIENDLLNAGEEMKRVITYGTFDLLHYGHINLLRRAKEFGDYLIVALSSDDFNWNEKHKKHTSPMSNVNSFLKLFAMLILLFLRRVGSKKALIYTSIMWISLLWGMTGKVSLIF